MFGPSHTAGSDVHSLSLKCFGTTKVTFNTGLGLQQFQSHLLRFSSSAKTGGRNWPQDISKVKGRDGIWKPMQSMSFYPLDLHQYTQPYIQYMLAFPTSYTLACWPSAFPTLNSRRLWVFKVEYLKSTIHGRDFCWDSHSALLIQHAEAKLHWSLMDKHWISSDRSGPTPSCLKRWESVTKSCNLCDIRKPWDYL